MERVVMELRQHRFGRVARQFFQKGHRMSNLSSLSQISAVEWIGLLLSLSVAVGLIFSVIALRRTRRRLLAIDRQLLDQSAKTSKNAESLTNCVVYLRNRIFRSHEFSKQHVSSIANALSESTNLVRHSIDETHNEILSLANRVRELESSLTQTQRILCNDVQGWLSTDDHQNVSAEAQDPVATLPASSVPVFAVFGNDQSELQWFSVIGLAHALADLKHKPVLVIDLSYAGNKRQHATAPISNSFYHDLSKLQQISSLRPYRIALSDSVDLIPFHESQIQVDRNNLLHPTQVRYQLRDLLRSGKVNDLLDYSAVIVNCNFGRTFSASLQTIFAADSVILVSEQSESAEHKFKEFLVDLDVIRASGLVKNIEVYSVIHESPSEQTEVISQRTRIRGLSQKIPVFHQHFQFQAISRNEFGELSQEQDNLRILAGDLIHNLFFDQVVHSSVKHITSAVTEDETYSLESQVATLSDDIFEADLRASKREWDGYLLEEEAHSLSPSEGSDSYLIEPSLLDESSRQHQGE